MPSSTKTMPQKARPKTAAHAGRSRWSPDARTREAIKILVDQAPPLTEEQKDQLRTLLARPHIGTDETDSAAKR